ncbi:aspartate ammonia-lyase [Mycolicibacterium canariasense]|uniref:Aspartate ammonia-lyase n=1 Tax=Mycolicibacterium canariasense TaxID=228230 RepID=A0A124E1M5_MYCCR|nr:aspartate ammonia-lyase [Mycolicibacterium canariasense]
MHSGSDIASLVRNRGLLTPSQLETILEPANLTRPWRAAGTG